MTTENEIDVSEASKASVKKKNRLKTLYPTQSDSDASEDGKPSLGDKIGNAILSAAGLDKVMKGLKGK